MFHLEWRVLNPALSLGFALVYIWTLLRAREDASRRRLLVAGGCLGLLFYAYFYFWTAAAAGLALCLVMDRRHAKVYFHVGWIGVLVGLPALVHDFAVRHATNLEAYQRINRFVNIPHFSNLIGVRSEALILLVAGYLIMRRATLSPFRVLVAHGLGSMLLINHQIFTGLQIENLHYEFICGPIVSGLAVACVLMLLTEWNWRAGRSYVLAGVLVIQIVAGVGLRVDEILRHPEPRRWATLQRLYMGQRKGAEPLRPNEMVAGDIDFALFATVVENQRPLYSYTVIQSPHVTNADWGVRYALNAFLLGITEDRFVAVRGEFLRTSYFGPGRRDPGAAAKLLEAEVEAFRRISADPAPMLERYPVRYVAIPSDWQTPAYVHAGWRLIQDGPTWRLWEHISNSNRSEQVSSK